MKSVSLVSLGVLVLAMAVVAAGAGQLAEEGVVPDPAQPPGETQVAQEFKKAAPELFGEWVARRPEVLRKASLGQRSGGPGGCNTNWFEFIECQDIAPPTDYKIDVTRTESLLTPFLGHLIVPVREKCSVRSLVPGAMSRSEKSAAALDPYCLGKPYEECTAAGAKPISKMSPGGCMGVAAFTFTHDGEVEIFYRWSEGKWEFESEKSEKPVPPRPAAAHRGELSRWPVVSTDSPCYGHG